MCYANVRTTEMLNRKYDIVLWVLQKKKKKCRLPFKRNSQTHANNIFQSLEAQRNLDKLCLGRQMAYKSLQNHHTVRMGKLNNVSAS